MKKNLILFALIVITGCTESTNPASKYCTDNGGKLVIAAEGEIRLCVPPDGDATNGNISKASALGNAVSVQSPLHQHLVSAQTGKSSVWVETAADATFRLSANRSPAQWMRRCALTAQASEG